MLHADRRPFGFCFTLYPNWVCFVRQNSKFGASGLFLTASYGRPRFCLPGWRPLTDDELFKLEAPPPSPGGPPITTTLWCKGQQKFLTVVATPPVRVYSDVLRCDRAVIVL